jgi:hypothetical protein
MESSLVAAKGKPRWTIFARGAILPAAAAAYSGAAGAGLFGGESRGRAIGIQDALDEFVEGVADQGVDGELY